MSGRRRQVHGAGAGGGRCQEEQEEEEQEQEGKEEEEEQEEGEERPCLEPHDWGTRQCAAMRLRGEQGSRVAVRAGGAGGAGMIEEEEEIWGAGARQLV